jgi:Cu-processing system ATP-binding protein
VWTDEVAARKLLAYVPEHPDLSPYASVGEILDLVCSLRKTGRSAGLEALEWVGLAELGGRTVRQLSKGQRRRAALAAARVATPRCLFFDEPLEGMDRGFRRTLIAWILEHRLAGGTAVIVSHDFEPFAQAADSALTVQHGRIQLVGDLPDDPNERLELLDRLAGGG